MSDDETRMFGAEIDADTAEILNTRLEYGEKSKLLRDFARSLAYGDGYDKQTAIDIQIERREEQLAEARKKRREADSRIESLEDDLARLRNRREDEQSREDKFESALVPIEGDLRGGSRMYEKVGSIQAVAREFQMEPKAVLERLKDRNPDIPERAFKPKSLQTDEWNGLPLKQQTLPVEKRGGSE